MAEELRQELQAAAEEAQDLSQVEKDVIELDEAREKNQALQSEKMRQLETELYVCAGRIQASKAISTFAEWLTVSELRRIKGLAKEAKKTWRETCERIGISTQTADQYLRLGDDLGDTFVADMSAIGVSIRALEAARKLPPEVRKRLTSGEVVDLEEVSKEELTEVIKDLAQENRKALDAKDELLEDETKARRKAENKAKETQQRLDTIAQRLADLKAGLPADDDEALEFLRKIEKSIVPQMMVLRFTKMQGRSPEAQARIIASVALMQELAEYVGNRLGALAAGEEPDDEVLSAAALATADEIAAHDGQPVPGL